jgi:hypothetical protein
VHRRRCSTARSVAYYRTREGRRKKWAQNRKRGKRQPPGPSEPVASAEAVAVEVGPAEAGPPQQNSRAREVGAGFDGDMLCYLRMLASLIEQRRVTRDEIVQVLAKNLRQHSLVRRRSIDYRVWYLNENPP